MPNPRAWVIPQLAHGIRGEVTVAVSSMVRDSSRLSIPNLAKASLNILEVMMMERYWSHRMAFISTPVMAVVATILTGRFGQLSRWVTILCNMPVEVMAAPKIIAQMMSQMVAVIPIIPEVLTNSLSIGMPVSSWVDPYSVVSEPLISPMVLSSPDI